MVFRRFSLAAAIWSNLLLIVLFTFYFLLFSFPTYACSVCFSAKEGQLGAYYFTTALLTLLPLGMIGGFIFWYRRQMRNR